MKKIYLFLMLTLSVVFINDVKAQDVLFGCTFPTTSGNAPSNITAECGIISTATIFTDGTNGSDDWTAVTSRVFFGGTTPVTTLCSVSTATGALSLVNIGSAYNGKSIVFKLSTINYENLILNYDTRGTGTGFTTQEWSYSTDGTTFTTYTSIGGRNATTFSNQIVDFSSISALDNQTNVYIKLTVSGASGTGNNRFDNINFSATTTVSAPEINIISGATNYLNNSTYNFGNVSTSTTVITTFAIQNLGLATLNLTTASFTGSSMYVINGAPIPATIAAGGILTFSVEYTPTAAGTHTGVLSVTSDDADENPYLFNISGVGVTPAPEINIISGATNYLNNATYNFGNVNTSTTVITTFAIQNLGLATLNLTTASFTGSSMYVVNGAPIPAAIAPGGILTFSFEYTPTAAGTHTGVLSVTSDDADENPYLFNVSGVGVVASLPEINIVQNVTSYTTGSTFNFSAEQNWFSDAVFTIENTGTGALSISTYTLVGTEYSLVGAMPTSVAASSTATFTVRFAPTAIGTFTGSITLNNNDANESTYVINLSGVSTASTPAIFTETFGNPGATTLIPAYTGWSSTGLTFTGSGDVRTSTPSTGYFGATGQGNAFLTAPGTRNIEISNINTSTCSSFTLSFGILKMQTAPDGSELLVEVSTDGVSYSPLTFPLLPTGTGTTGWYYRTASGTIPQAANLRIRFTNTSATTQFRIDDVQLKGVCAPAPEINIIGGATNYLNNATYNFGNVSTSTTVITTFAIQNLGLATLNLTTASFTGSSMYVINGAPIPATIAAGGILTFSFEYTPTAAGTHTGFLSITSDDADENPYLFNISGVGVIPVPEINIKIGASNYANNSTYSFGSVALSGTYTAIITVENTGTAALNAIGGNTTNTTEYSILGVLPPYSIAAGAFQTFTMVFTPTVAGTFTNILSLVTNDTDESTYTVTFTGVGVAASASEINVVQNATSYTTGSTFNFNAEQNWFTDVVFTIENTGTGALSISTYTLVGIEYSLVGTMPTSVAASSSANFTLRFAPTTLGTFTGSITLNNNDANESTYVINLSGISTAATPSIFTETFGNPGVTTLIPAYTGWSSTGLTFTGSGDVRTSTPSTGYFGATGQGNAFLANTAGKYIEISNINTSTCSSFTLSFGIYKDAVAADGSNLAVEVSTDGVSYTPLTFPLLPTGAGTVAWYYRTASGTIPQAANLRIRFKNTVVGSFYRIDDVQLKGVCPPAPEVNVMIGAVNYANNSTYNYGTVTTGGTYTVVGTIQNTGTAVLNVTNGNTTNTTEFNAIGAATPFSIAAGTSQTFTMSFAPTVTGTFTNILTLESDDADESTYTVTFTGVATVPAPEINIKQGATTYTSGSSYSFANTTILTSNTVVFTIENTGNADLNISNSLNTGPEFAINSSYTIPFTIVAGNTATFSVTFGPTVIGTYNGNITFTNNDSDEPNYVLAYTGVAQNTPEPEINVVTTSLDFGSIEENTTADLTYVVQNTGNANLVVSTSTTAPFSIVGTPPTTITAGNSATYTVRFSPTTTGTFTANVTITSNDADEPSLTVTLIGIATVGSPVVFTETFGTPSGTTLISSYSGWSNPTLTFAGTGDVRTSTPSSYSGASGSGNVFLTTGGTRNIIISNINTSTCTGLSLSFGVQKSVSGATGSELTVEVSADGTTYTPLTFSALPAGTGWNYVTASGTIPQAANLRIRFTNTSTTVQYRIDDVKLKGSCGASTTPEINVKQATTSIASSGTFDFGSVASGTKDVVFTIENTGTAALTISSNSITGSQYSLVGSMPTSVAAGSTADFTIQFSSPTSGAFVGSITIANTDSDEGSYVINFTASVPTSIEETKTDDAISIYPNPNKGTILHFNKTTDATIYNAIGAKVIEVKNVDKVDVSVLENGIYLVNINNKTKRLIIAK